MLDFKQWASSFWDGRDQHAGNLRVFDCQWMNPELVLMSPHRIIKALETGFIEGDGPMYKQPK